MALDVSPDTCPLGNNYRYGPPFDTAGFFASATNATIATSNVLSTATPTFKLNGATDTPGDRERRFFARFRFQIDTSTGGARVVMCLINDSLVSGAYGGGVTLPSSFSQPGKAWTGQYNGGITNGAALIVASTYYLMEVNTVSDGTGAITTTTRLYSNLGVLLETLTASFTGVLTGEYGAPTLYCMNSADISIELLEWYYQSKNPLGYTSCAGPVPTYSSILPASTGKISKALLLKGDLTPALAATLHNQLKGAT